MLSRGEGEKETAAWGGTAPNCIIRVNLQATEV